MEFIEVSAKTVNDAITEACQRLTVTSDKLEYEVVEEGSSGFLGIGSKPAVIKARVKSSVEDTAKDFLKDVFEAMNLTVVVDVKYDEDNYSMDIDLNGDEMGVLIGKRGQTLDSLQYLVSLVVNKNVENYIRVKVDTENYRQRRRETLENLAKNISYKVKRTKRSVSLEPMNPYERRIIHSALQNDKYVTTYSEGDEPFRHVVVALKKYDKGERRTDRNFDKISD
ncbi:MAG: protein jag [Clostridiales bacterium]|nr:protein jag [Clostridiales bacterium]